MKINKFLVTGMSCAACEKHVREAVLKINGVQDVDINLISSSMTVTGDDAINPDVVIAAVKDAGYGAELCEEDSGFRIKWNKRKANVYDNLKRMRFRLFSSVCLLIPLIYISMGGMLRLPYTDLGGNVALSVSLQLILTAVILLINKHFYISGFKALIQKAPNMDTLVSIGSLSAFLYGIWAVIQILSGIFSGNIQLVHKYSHMLYLESAAMILTLVTVGKYLETLTKNKTSDILNSLINLSPQAATVIRNGQEVVISVDDIVPDEIVVIRPGQSIPADGTVIDGRGFVDQSAITGESMPVEKNPGDEVVSVTINKNGSFTFRAERVGNDTVFAQIIKLIDDAGSTKAPIARLADKVSGVFVPIVIFIAILTAAVWLLAGQSVAFALNCAISVLVISCPCALGLATPVAITAGIGKAAERGVLIKSAEVLEQLHNVDTVALDKTGTVTLGEPVVADVDLLSDELKRDDLLAIAASLELKSEHPLAAAIVNRAKDTGINILPVDNFTTTLGRGVEGTINGQKYYAGNKSFTLENGCDISNSASNLEEKYLREAKTVVWISEGKVVLGLITLIDGIRDTSGKSINDFKALGLNTILLTGDNKSAAETVSCKTGIDKTYSNLLPQDKDRVIQELQEAGHKVIMIGDGINDAPALVRADVGAAIGAGTDIAIDSADIILVKNSLADAVYAINLSHSVIKIIKENLFWAFFYNLLALPVASGVLFPLAGIMLTPMIAAAAMSISSVSVVLNALRLRFFKNKILSKPKIKRLKNIEMKESRMQLVELNINGMMCVHCQTKVQKTLESIDGVRKAVVNIENKTAIVTIDEGLNPELLMDAVKNEGYEPVSYKILPKKGV